MLTVISSGKKKYKTSEPIVSTCFKHPHCTFAMPDTRNSVHTADVARQRTNILSQSSSTREANAAHINPGSTSKYLIHPTSI